jgi:hypothetical protein
LQLAQTNDGLELDELWSFVGTKKRQMWLGIALCRRTRQVVAYTLGDRSTQTCQELYKKLPEAYRQCQTYSDFWVRGRKSASTPLQTTTQDFRPRKLTKRFFLKQPIKPWAKKRVRRTMLNAGITPYGNAGLALFLKPYRSLNL